MAHRGEVARDDAARRRLSQALDALSEVQLELDEERLRRERAEALLDQLLTAMSDAVLVVDARGTVSRVNDAAIRLFGLRADELVDTAPDALLDGDVPVTPWELLTRDATGRIVVDAAARRPDGDQTPVSLSGGIIRDPSGKVTGAVYAARDLSEVHRLLREVESAEARWRLLAEVGDILAAESDPSDALDEVAERVVAATGGALALLLVSDGVVEAAVSAGEVGLLREVEQISGAAVPRASALGRVLAGGETVYALPMPAGYPLLGLPDVDEQLDSAAVVSMSAKGETVGAAVVASRMPGGIDDATVQAVDEVASRLALTIVNARLHDSLIENRAAAEAARFRDEILAAISHDMKTPLAVMMGLVDILAGESDAMEAADRERHFAILQRQVRRMRRLIVQFLDYIRMEAGHELSIVPRRLDTARFVTEVVATFQEEGRLEVEIPDDVPDALADESRLDLALANLLSNALKFSPPDTLVTVIVESRGAQMEIAVVDHGQGIAPADQSRIFERFSRADTDGPEGTGLGLYMTRELMRSQDGDVRVASRPGGGSRFSLILPVAGGRGA
jgi:PAS domain S-box-containing protein